MTDVRNQQMMARRSEIKLLPLVVVVVVAVVVVCNYAVSSYAHQVEEEREKGESWTVWAKDKIQEGLGLKNQQEVDDAGKPAPQIIKGIVSLGNQALLCYFTPLRVFVARMD